MILERKRHLQTLTVIVMIAVMLIGMMPVNSVQAASASKPAAGICTTKVNTLNVRERATTSSPVISGIKPGGYVQVIGESGNYYKIKYSKSSVGYAYKKYVKIVTEDYGTAATNGGTLNFRQSPDTSSKIITTLSNKSAYPIIKTSGSWYQIVVGKTTGYVHSSYFIKAVDTAALRNEVVDYAKTFLGVYYQWGGNYPASGYYGLDCSHFTYQVLKKFGLMNNYLTSANQASTFKKISRSELKPGDLVFYKSNSTGKVVHVAIYIGDGKIIGANGGDSSVTTAAKAKAKNAMVKTASIDYDNRSKLYGRVIFD